MDVEAPQGVFIYDNSVTEDQDWTNIDNELSGSWAFEDSLSGVASYQYAIGTSEGATDVVDWTENGLETSFNLNGLSLQSGVTYYHKCQSNGCCGQ